MSRWNVSRALVAWSLNQSNPHLGEDGFRDRYGDGVANWPVLVQAVASPMCCNDHRLRLFERLARLDSGFRHAAHFSFADSHDAETRYKTAF